MSKYLFLNEDWHADTWVNGGEVPLSMASHYRHVERGGVLTPDENIHSTFDADIREYGFYSDDIEVRNMLVVGGGLPSKYIDGSRRLKDALVWCLTNAEPGGALLRRFGKKACVRIDNIAKMKEVIDEQVGSESVAGDCKYTWGYQRDHFTKSALDRWQEEYRLVWEVQKARTIVLPRGLSTRIPVWPGMWDSGSFFRCW